MQLRYLLENPDHLPDRSALSANGKCASLWCVTGRWCTLQGTVRGAGRGGAAGGGMLTNLMVLVPMPRLWGMVGWWWYVPATVAYPFLVPMLVTMGMASLVPRDTATQSQEVEGHN